MTGKGAVFNSGDSVSIRWEGVEGELNAVMKQQSHQGGSSTTPYGILGSNTIIKASWG